MTDTSLTLTFLGTSHGVPDVDRYCSSTLLSVGEKRYFIDGGAPAADFLTRQSIPFSSVKALFNTHAHSDHLLACLPMLSLINWFYTDAAIDVYIPEETVVTAVRDLLTLSDGAFCPERVRFHAFGPDFVYDDGSIRLTPIPTKHLAHVGRPAYAFLVEAAGKRVLFSGDMRADLADFPEILYREPVDMFITECAHCSVKTLAEKLQDPRFQAKAVTVTHIHPLPVKEPQFEELAKQLPFPLTVARDGQVITL